LVRAGKIEIPLPDEQVGGWPRMRSPWVGESKSPQEEQLLNSRPRGAWGIFEYMPPSFLSFLQRIRLFQGWY
jgi:hypothetical protein